MPHTSLKHHLSKNEQKTGNIIRNRLDASLHRHSHCHFIFLSWLDNSEEAIILRNAKGEVVDRTPVVSDTENDNRYWIRNNSEWTFSVKELEKGELWSGYIRNVVDGDTVDVSFSIYGIQRVRLVGINRPEIGEEGYEEAKEFVNSMCIGEEFKLDVDDMERYDLYYRILGVVYVNDTNLNEKIVREGYAEIMYIPPSEKINFYN